MAAKQIGLTEIPCIRLDEMTDDERREYAILHNWTAEQSEWDFDELENEIAELDLEDFELGFDFETVPEVDEFGTDFSLPDGEKPEICQMTFILHEKQKQLIEYAIECVKDQISETFGNTNVNGNSLYEVIREWAEQRK